MTTSATPEAVDLVHDELERLWSREPGVAPADRMRFETGLIEILGNVVEHASRLDDAAGGRRLSVDIDVDPAMLTAVLEDDGLPARIDLSAVTLPDPEAESGRGLALALAALDDLRHERVGDRNRWTLVCRRAGT